MLTSIYKSLKDLRDVNHFNAWINRIVYSFFIKSVRTKQVRKRVELFNNSNLELVIKNNASTNPNEIYNVAEMTDEIISNILNLSYDQQMIAKLRFLDELSIKEISKS